MAADGIALLRARAALTAKVRAFFAARGVLEVDTPLLGDGLVVEAHIDPVPVSVRLGPGAPQARHLLTSPEGPMKRLLAAGSGPIYQLARAFRDGEVGRRHAVEFTMLEWYRPGFDHHQLMDEVEALVGELLPDVAAAPFDRVTYRDLFVHYAGLDPFAVTPPDVLARCRALGVDVPAGLGAGSLDDALDLVLVSHIEPQLGRARPVFVHDYPPSQAALARVQGRDGEGPATAARFELYHQGVELANGYHELADAAEQRARFEAANRQRVQLGRRALPLDEALLAALAAGFPDCAGVALGFDRLVMLAGGIDRIESLRQP
ncbi:MAG: EF-P lysine aminoacylase EpmA [Planctomycetota bacterium]